MWFLSHIAPDRPAYNIARAVRIRSEVDIEGLRNAFQRLVDRHGALRTNFKVKDGYPVQMVHREAEVRFRVEHATSWEADHLEERVASEA